jgi:hypothetical protein
MATRQEIEDAVDRLANEAENAWAKNGDLLEATSEQVDLPVSELIDRVANELRARFDYS